MDWATNCEITFLALPRLAYIVVGKTKSSQESQQTHDYYIIATELAKANENLLV